MEPLAHRMRPKSFSDIFGQDHLVGDNGILTAMVKKNRPMSMILYGPPGTGKTTIAGLFCESFEMDYYFFNAVTDNKSRLKSIIETINYHNILLVIDEIHRMKSDIQDYLLPFIEEGKVIIIGLTTANPFQSINIAIRSRCHLFEVHKLTSDDIRQVLSRAIKLLDVDIKVELNAYETIVRYSNYEVRTALNILESASLLLNDGDTLTSGLVTKVAGRIKHELDAGEDHFYDLLSALQKSIRGSDVDASIHYLARLLTLGDLISIARRLIVIAYEDIGLANPNMGQRVYFGCEAALKVGLPEARIIFANLVIDMAISPKSNTAYLAIDNALKDYESMDTGDLPDHAINRRIQQNPSIYLYPHNDKNSINSQLYLPEKIKSKAYYLPKVESNYEKALAERLKLIDKIKNKTR
ncbi:MAG TPA: replication-associated recombination protein A [Acholeplasma sp.]|jgi:putative ATPase|nr:replication-associated recombination protein A [Acholeplasma sp.]